MKIEVRQITEEHWPVINEWCRDWSFSEIAQEGLVPSYGAIAYYGETPVYSGFVYLTDSIVAHPEWIVCNKNFTDKEVRKIAFKELFSAFESYAKDNGRSLLILSVKNQFLLKSLEEIGFNKTDVEMTNLIKQIV